MAIIGWARVSTEAQSLDAQIAALEAAQCDKLFSSKHSGKGRGKNLEKLAELLDYVREGDTVAVTKIDRLGRSLKEVLQTVDMLRSKGVTLKAIEQGIDTSNDDAMSNAMLGLLGLFAEMERNFIKERLQAGKEVSGNFGGRKKTLDDATRDYIRKSHQEGKTQYSLAKEFNVTKTTIHRIVHS
jgi:DNA invertase Pin-like site-specific DNA recombinase